LVKQNNNTKVLTSVDIFMQRVVNRFLFRFSIVFKNDRFVFGKKLLFLKTTHSFWNLRKTICDRFLYNCLKEIMLTVVNEGLSLSIVNETTNFIKTVVCLENDRFWKKYMQLYWMSSYMKLNSCGGAKTSLYFLKNYLMISTDALQVGFHSSLTIVNEGSSLTIVNETTSLYKQSFWKTIVLKTTIFKKQTLKKRSFRFRFFVVVFITKRSFFKIKESVNIPIYASDVDLDNL